MSREISLFTDYHNNEDRITNYFGLMLKMLHEESPLLFHEVLASFLGDSMPQIALRFEQQVKNDASRPDMCITQLGFSLWFENKVTDWFHGDQLGNHLRALNDLPQCCGDKAYKTLILLCGVPIDPKRLSECRNNEQGIKIMPIIYSEIVPTVREALRRNNYSLTNTFSSFLDEFETYLDEHTPQGDWEHLLDVVNTSSTVEEVLSRHVYVCPNTGGAYSHRRALFFGTYKDKQTQYVARIEGVVTATPSNSAQTDASPSAATASSASPLGSLEVKYCNFGDEQQLVAKAEKYLSSFSADSWVRTNDAQIFILSEPVPVEAPFCKDSKGGMLGSKVYFSLPKHVDTAKKLADYLNGKAWSDIKG